MQLAGKIYRIANQHYEPYEAAIPFDSSDRFELRVGDETASEGIERDKFIRRPGRWRFKHGC